jgi:hypothetical protein
MPMRNPSHPGRILSCCLRQNLRFLESFRKKYIAIKTVFAANLCDTCLPLFSEGRGVAQLESLANGSRILFQRVN